MGSFSRDFDANFGQQMAVDQKRHIEKFLYEIDLF